MRALLIAEGNLLRRDDGAAHEILHQLELERLSAVPEETVPDVESRALLQLTPEMAEEMAGYDAVIFMDADVGAIDLSVDPINPIDKQRSPPALSHISRPADIVGLARALFGFAGRAFLCRIPAHDLSCGEGMSPRTSALAAQAAAKIETLLRELRAEPGKRV